MQTILIIFGIAILILASGIIDRKTHPYYIPALLYIIAITSLLIALFKGLN